MGEDQAVTRERWRLANYFATYDPTSLEYAIARLVGFAALTVLFLGLGLLVTPGLGVFGVFCLFATILWWRRWRRAREDDERARR